MSFLPNLDSRKCYKCGEKFEKGHLEKCTAIGRTCYNCGKLNHLSAVCKSRKTPRKNIQYLQENENESSSDEDVYSIFQAPQELVIQAERTCRKLNVKTNENADSAIYSISKQKHKLRIIKINNANIHMLRFISNRA